MVTRIKNFNSVSPNYCVILQRICENCLRYIMIKIFIIGKRMNLNADVLGVILGFVNSPAAIVNFSIACKKHMEIYQEYINRQSRAIGGGIVLSNMQYVISKELSTASGVIAIQAPMGFGKTILGYACCQGLTVIVTTSNTYKVWLEEATKIKWYNPKPEKSRIICYHNSRPKHTAYLRGLKADDKRWDDMIIVTTDNYLYDIIKFFKGIFLKKRGTVIVDEAHDYRKKIFQLQYCVGLNENDANNIFHREILLSGSRMCPKQMKFVGKGYAFPIHRYIKIFQLDPVPNIIWNIKELEKSFINDPEEWSRAVRSILRRHDKICLVTTEEQKDSLVSEETFKNIKFIKIGQGISAVNKFSKVDGKAVLWVNTNQNEGINVLAEGMIVLHPSIMNVGRMIQTAMRIVRPTNKRKEVFVHFLCCGIIETMRAHYARYYSYNDWRNKWGYNSHPDHSYLHKTSGMLRMLGRTYKTISQVDGCIIYADYALLNLTAKQVIDWWKSNLGNEETILTEEIIYDIIGPTQEHPNKIVSTNALVEHLINLTI